MTISTTQRYFQKKTAREDRQMKRLKQLRFDDGYNAYMAHRGRMAYAQAVHMQMPAAVQAQRREEARVLVNRAKETRARLARLEESMGARAKNLKQ